MEGSECLQGEEVKTEHRKLFQAVCYSERLRSGTVSGGGMYRKTSSLFETAGRVHADRSEPVERDPLGSSLTEGNCLRCKVSSIGSEDINVFCRLLSLIIIKFKLSVRGQWKYYVTFFPTQAHKRTWF